MTKGQKRDLATSLTTMVFLVIGITGVLMFFHIFDNYTKQLHEILGLAFVGVVLFHIFFNWNSMKSYFSKKVFALSAIVIMVISLGFIVSAPEGKSPKRVMIESIIKAPLDASIVVLGVDKDLAFAKLEEKGIVVGTSKNINELSKENRTSPFEIVDIIIKE